MAVRRDCLFWLEYAGSWRVHALNAVQRRNLTAGKGFRSAQQVRPEKNLSRVLDFLKLVVGIKNIPANGKRTMFLDEHGVAYPDQFPNSRQH